MGKKYKRRATDRIRFSIGAKLIIIISFIVVISLGSITALVSWLVQQDLQVSAEENNFELNRRSAMEAETALINTRSGSRILIQTITAMGRQASAFQAAIIEETTNFFFTENPQIAAVFFINPGDGEQLLINRTVLLFAGDERRGRGLFFQEPENGLGARRAWGDCNSERGASFCPVGIGPVLSPAERGSGRRSVFFREPE